MGFIEPIRKHCYNILPLVYDDSLSYYEVLCKVQAKCNELIENYNNDFDTMITKYIEDHFNEIMVNASYNEELERITFQAEIIADGDHTYNINRKAIEIENR